MAQLQLRGMVVDVYYSVPSKGSKVRDESTYVTYADMDGGMLKIKFPGKFEAQAGQIIEGTALINGRLYGNSMILIAVSHSFKKRGD